MQPVPRHDVDQQTGITRVRCIALAAWPIQLTLQNTLSANLSLSAAPRG
jgi:hypothetical protein